MIADDYGNPLTTTSSAARDAYVAGYRLLFMTCLEADTEFARATEADPGFALAYPSHRAGGGDEGRRFSRAGFVGRRQGRRCPA